MLKVELANIAKVGNKLRTITQPYLYAIAEGEIDNHYALHKFGTNEDIDTSEETVWSEGGIYVYPSSATIMTVSSASTDDAGGGTGARSVRVIGQDNACNEQDELIQLNGQTGVSTTKSYLRVYRMTVEQVGSGNQNAGIVYIGTGAISTGKPAVVYGSIAVGTNQTQMALWTVPAGYEFYLIEVYGTEAADQRAKLRLYVREKGGVFQLKFELGMIAGTAKKIYQLPFRLESKTDIEIRAIGEQVNCDISAGFDGWYEKD